MDLQAPVFDKENKIWSSPKSLSIFNKNVSIGEIALNMLNFRPEETICQISVSEGKSLTAAEISSMSKSVAEHLRDLGLDENDVVGIVAPNTSLLLPVVLGCWVNCTPFHAVNPIFEVDVIKHTYDKTRPKVIFCDGNVYEKVKHATNHLGAKFYALCNHRKGVPKVDDILHTPVSPLFSPTPLKHGPTQTMAIYNTSGTTGKPKCSTMSNECILMNVTNIDSSSTLFSTSELDWGTGLFITVLNLITGAKRIVTTRPITSEYILEILKQHNVTFLLATPMQIAEMVTMPNCTDSFLPSLRLIAVTGSPLSNKTLQTIQANLGSVILAQSYGCTEFGSIAMNLFDYQMGVLGVIVPGVQIRIIDPEEKNSLGNNEPGEIVVYHDEKWLGYIGDELATREMLDENGWWHTGDIGYMDDDNVLHFCDRHKDVMKYKNFQFSPIEIEETILELEDVLDICVFGVYNDKFGDLAAAAVVKREGSKLSIEEVIDYVAKKLKSDHKCLNYGAFFIKKIERNTNGKVLRNKMRELCLNENKKF